MYDTISHAFPQKKIHYSIEKLLIDVDTRDEKYHSMKKLKQFFILQTYTYLKILDCETTID